MAQKRENRVYRGGEIRPTREHKVVRGRPSPESMAAGGELRAARSVPRRPGKKRKGKRSAKKKALAVILVVILCLGLCGFLLFQYMFEGLTIRPITQDPAALGVNAAAQEQSRARKVTNIALFGVDSRDPEQNTGRSDSIMILSVDRQNHILKLTSILRDSKVAIPGHGEEKIAHAYAYGGAELAIRTINENFHLDIQDYVTVNFTQLTHVVDAVGGIELEITEAEREQINRNLESQGTASEPVTESGLVHLNGAQATAYARIRKIDSDSVRADRQRKVMGCLLENVQSMSWLEYPGLVRTVLPMVETSLGYTDIIGFAPMLAGGLTMEQNAVPNEEDNAVGGGNPWVWKFDLEAASDRLHRFIYETGTEAS